LSAHASGVPGGGFFFLLLRLT